MIGTTHQDRGITTNTLAEQINRAHADCERAARAGLDHAIHAGELLAEAKSQCNHGQWLPWLAANCPTISTRTAQVYMRVASRRNELANAQASAHFTLEDAVLMLAESRGQRIEPLPQELIWLIPPVDHVLHIYFSEWDCALIMSAPTHPGYLWAAWVEKDADGKTEVFGNSKPMKPEGLPHLLPDRFLTPTAYVSTWKVLMPEGEQDRIVKAWCSLLSWGDRMKRMEAAT